MHATQPPRRLHSVPLQTPHRAAPRPARPRRSAQRPVRHQAERAIEISFKLSANVILALAAATALIKLLPYGFVQQAKLQEIHGEVTLVRERVDRLQTDFSRNFDPQQAQAVMQEQSSRVDPQQRQVIWVTPAQPNSRTTP